MRTIYRKLNHLKKEAECRPQLWHGFKRGVYVTAETSRQLGNASYDILTSVQKIVRITNL